MQKLSKLTAALFLLCFSFTLVLSACTNGEGDKPKQEPVKKVDSVPAQKMDSSNPKPTSPGG